MAANDVEIVPYLSETVDVAILEGHPALHLWRLAADRSLSDVEQLIGGVHTRDAVTRTGKANKLGPLPTADVQRLEWLICRGHVQMCRQLAPDELLADYITDQSQSVTPRVDAC